MSVEKNRREAERWFKTALGDFESAVILMKNTRYAHSCFHSQQSGEKAIKALWYLLDADPWGHSIKKLLNGLGEVDLRTYQELKYLEKSAIILDRFYITTRYPNGLPELIPDEAYLEEDAESCIENAKKIIKAIKSLIGT
jgi:HEPN domain-containing protein